MTANPMRSCACPLFFHCYKTWDAVYLTDAVDWVVICSSDNIIWVVYVLQLNDQMKYTFWQHWTLQNLRNLNFNGGHCKRCQVVNSLKSLLTSWSCCTVTNITKDTQLTGMDEIHGLFPIPYLRFVNKL